MGIHAHEIERRSNRASQAAEKRLSVGRRGKIHASGAEAHGVLLAFFGTTKVVP
jgi:hypothetical protein